ncbi:hypothetical protein ACFO25_18000 [Paenactinomyces guangxiensis]|uniref:Uncharacterized protein n=1 Tax=Paenactinomyces guangxiensis TaxID=1490290 RepID=A0A7W2A8Y2_9BACL|nr:hypothetical protein [Paenactinomyces guangxiensis]MBA4494642.1 hypothetical protein [Paenactinomyces guangxiensis]MBH8591726.1 hypothetical protein [Paenactinomyces guangxiensis]
MQRSNCKHKRGKRKNKQLQLIIKLLRQLINRPIIPNITVNANPTAQAAQDHAQNAGTNMIDEASDSDIKIETTIREKGPGNQNVL